MQKKAGIFKPGDFFIAILVCFLAVLLIFVFYVFPKDGKTLVVHANGSRVEYPLHTDTSFSLEANGYTLSIVIEDGYVFVASSDCIDGICRSTGKIKDAGQSIVCAPGGVVLEIVGNEGEIDGTAG